MGTLINVDDFGGEIPSRSPRLLPPANSDICENVWLNENTLDTYSIPSLVKALAATTKYVFRVPNTDADIPNFTVAGSTFMEFDDPDTKVVQGIIVNDSFERYYWAIPGQSPLYNTKARIIAASAPYLLGIPTPAAVLTVTPVGGVGLTEYRAYCFTYLSEHGSEGPPSPPVIASGPVDASWDLVLPAITGGESAQRSITKRRVYRTVTGSQGDTNYYFVVELLIATLAYSDVIPGTTVTGNGLIPSTAWIAPPTTLRGLISMPNGMLAGFTGRDIYFCEPYRPHAWPAAYSVSVEQPIIGLGVIGTTLVVLTAGNPVLITGIHPSVMTQTKHSDIVPCVSAGSIVSAPEGVYYASHVGLMLAANGTIRNTTEQLISARQWLSEYQPKTMRAIFYKGNYFALQTILVDGFKYQPGNVKHAINHIKAPAACSNNIIDVFTGTPAFISSGFLYEWDSSMVAGRIAWHWKSKEFVLPKPENLAAFMVEHEVIPANSQSDAVEPWALASYAMLPKDKFGVIKIYADRVLVLERDFPAKSGETVRIPSGFKADLWSVELTARVRVDSWQLAASVKDLAQA